MEIWSQLTIETEASPDEELLVDTILPLVTELRDRIECWHFFWEPDLWIRLRWKTADAQTDGHEWISAHLDHPQWRFDDYDWEADADMMGRELWVRCQRDWMNGSELALAHLSARKEHRDTKSAEFLWARHVHLFSNQLVGTWSEEARLSIRQARYRIWLLSRMQGNESERPALEAHLEKLDAVLSDMERAKACETSFVDRWRRDGRPPLVERLDLPDDFWEKRADDGVVTGEED